MVSRAVVSDHLRRYHIAVFNDRLRKRKRASGPLKDPPQPASTTGAVLEHRADTVDWESSAGSAAEPRPPLEVAPMRAGVIPPPVLPHVVVIPLSTSSDIAFGVREASRQYFTVTSKVTV